MEDIGVGIIGCAGRMGRNNLDAVLGSAGLRLTGGVERCGHPALGQDLGLLAGRDPLGLAVTDDLAALIGSSDVLIEFSSPEATLDHLRMVAEAGRAHVIGTTGFSAEQMQALQDLATRCPVVWSANMSLGVNLLLGLAERVAAALDADWDAEILEMHHRHKVDAPSGTALALGRAVAAGRRVVLDEVAVRSRDGVGEHVVMFAGEAERIELAHRATDRKIFARGAVRAARWLAGRPAGLYGMSDILGF
jgi:4-hydroxy-tetrahydrodipicolinate reductase